MESESGDTVHRIGLLGAESQAPAAGAPGRRRVILAVLTTTLFWLLAGGGYTLIVRRPEPVAFAIQPPPATSTPLPSPTPGPVFVEVTGAVRSPGVYELPPGSRVEQAIVAAGGLRASADAGQMSLAQLVYDGQQLVVPEVPKGQPTAALAAGSRSAGVDEPTSPSAGNAATPSGLALNVNTATAEELDALPGIGPVTAEAIVAFREANGPFTSIESLLDVKGIGKATLAKFRDLITVQ